jgi:hypothetical protein
MANNYNFYANESTVDKDERVEGVCLQKLHDKLNENLQNKYFQHNDEQFTSYGRRKDESYNKMQQRRTNNSRIYTRTTTKLNENYDNSLNYGKRDMHNDNTNINSNKKNYLYPINNQSLSYATDMHLTPLRIKCNLTLPDKNTALKFVREFFKRIENSFRNTYKDHKKTIGFDYWFDRDDDLVGITKDITLYVYLYDGRNYPEQIDSVRLIPLLPVRLPPQHAIVIKFVPNDYSFDELEDDLKNRYLSIYHIEEMNGTRRIRSRHIRMDIYDKDEYNC